MTYNNLVNKGDIIVNSLSTTNYVRLGGVIGNGGNLHKFMMNENNTQLYIPQDGEKFAAFTMENAIGEMPINFKAAQNGTYTITVHVENASYLHLIDNLTGVDTDLLAISSKGLGSYTFTALTTDYASRFKLVFSMTGIGENVFSVEDVLFFNLVVDVGDFLLVETETVALDHLAGFTL